MNASPKPSCTIASFLLLTLAAASLPEDNRVSYGQFIGDLADEIHAVDPNHPVTTTVAWTGAWD